MNTPAKYFIVEADAMPEIFRKVAEAKRLLETGEETTVNGATRAVGISRSAFYKYKDSVRPFNDMLHGRIVTFQILLKDEPGILSGVLNVFAGTGVNILTINQNIPAALWRRSWGTPRPAPGCSSARYWPDNPRLSAAGRTA